MFCRKCGGEGFDADGRCLRCGWTKAGRAQAPFANARGTTPIHGGSGTGPAHAPTVLPKGNDPEALFYQSTEHVTPGIMRVTDGTLRWQYGFVCNYILARLPSDAKVIYK